MCLTAVARELADSEYTLKKYMPNNNDKILLQILEISVSLIYTLISSLLSWGHNVVIIMKIINRGLCERNKVLESIITQYY